MLIGKRLEAYLARLVHGRKPQRSCSSRIPKGPPRDEAYKWIRTLPCVGCGAAGRSEAAHTGEDGGMSMKPSDYSCVPLCSDWAPGASHRMASAPFERDHQILLVEQLNREHREKCA